MKINDDELFKTFLFERNFEGAKEFIHNINKEGYAIDEWFFTEDLEKTLNAYRGEDFKNLVQNLYDVFVYGHQSDFFLYIDLDELESIQDLIELLPAGMRGAPPRRRNTYRRMWSAIKKLFKS